MLAGAAAFGQTGGTGSAPPGATSTPPSAMSSTSMSATAMTPTGVLSLIHQVNQDEIRLGQLAESKASSAKVKDYAKGMVTDHGNLDKQVNDFATQNKLTLGPSSIPAEKRSQLTNMTQSTDRQLATATGAQFDREYMRAMSDGHGTVLADLDAALPSLKAKNDKVYDLVKSARDKVETHKKHADDLLRDLGNTATGGSGLTGPSGTTTPSGSSTTTPSGSSTTTPSGGPTGGGPGR